MKLNPRARQKLRVHELAAELGWTSRQLLAELASRGEFAKSAASTSEAPVVRAIRRDFAPAPAMLTADDVISPESYGLSAGATAAEEPDESFEEALRRVKARSEPPYAPHQTNWVPPISAALLLEVVAPHGSHPTSRDRKEAKRLHRDWAAACLHGLDDDEATMIEWIQVSGGRWPLVAAELSRADINAKELRSDLAMVDEKIREGQLCSNGFEIERLIARRPPPRAAECVQDRSGFVASDGAAG